MEVLLFRDGGTCARRLKFCSHYGDKRTVATLLYGQFGNGIENDGILEHAQHEFAHVFVVYNRAIMCLRSKLEKEMRAGDVE